MATLQDAIGYIQTLVTANIASIRAAPAYPPEKIAEFPFAVCYASSGEWVFGAGGTKKGLHTIALEVHVARKDLSRAVQAAMAYSDSIPNLLLKNPTLGGNASTFGRIRYKFGPLGWNGVDTFGFTWFIDDVKTEAALT